MTNWRALAEFLRLKGQAYHVRYEEITIQNEEQLAKYRPKFPDARIGTTIRVQLRQRFIPTDHY